MRLLVMMKAVPSGTEIAFTAGRGQEEMITNPADNSALEEALRLREETGGSVTVMSMGAQFCENMLRQAVAKGADEAVLLSDMAFAGADTAATSRVLACAVKYLGGYDVIFCGVKSTDGETGQVGPELAARLGIAFAGACTEIYYEGERMLCNCMTSTGSEKLSLPLPCVLSTVCGINSPRLPGLKGLRRAARTEILRLDGKKLGIGPEHTGQAGSPTIVVRSVSVTFDKRRAEFIDAGQLDRLVERLAKEASE